MVETASKTQAFQLKGSLFTLSVLHVMQNDLEAFNQQLEELVTQAPKFFQNAPIVLDLQALDENMNIDFKAIGQQLRKHSMVPVGTRGGSPEQQQAAKDAGLAILSLTKSDTMEAPTQKTKKAKKTETPAREYQTKLITAPVRSGQQIYAKNADLIVTNSVSPGAELLADGNIHIYGPLRGRALAGISGNKNARIFCQEMEAELVSIAGAYIVNEALIQSAHQGPKQIYLDDGKLKITSL